MKKALLIALSTFLLSQCLADSSLGQATATTRPAGHPTANARDDEDGPDPAPDPGGMPSDPGEGYKTASRSDGDDDAQDKETGPMPMPGPMEIMTLLVMCLFLALPWAIVIGFIAVRKGRSGLRWGLIALAPAIYLLVIRLVSTARFMRRHTGAGAAILVGLVLVTTAAYLAVLRLVSLTDIAVLRRLEACERRLADRGL